MNVAWAVKLRSMWPCDPQEVTPNLVFLRLSDAVAHLQELEFTPDVPPGIVGKWHWHAPEADWFGPDYAEADTWPIPGAAHIEAEIVRMEVR